MKINDKSFSFLGDFSETVMRGIFIALIPVAIIVLIGMILWARSQNAATKDGKNIYKTEIVAKNITFSVKSKHNENNKQDENNEENVLGFEYFDEDEE